MYVFSLGRINTHDDNGKHVRPWTVMANPHFEYMNDALYMVDRQGNRSILTFPKQPSLD